jgi:hypothetical protein
MVMPRFFRVIKGSINLPDAIFCERETTNEIPAPVELYPLF